MPKSWMTLEQAFALRTGASQHHGPTWNETSAIADLGDPVTVPLTMYNPTALSFETWFDELAKMQAELAMLTVKYWQGMCLYPSEISEFHVGNTDWYGIFNRIPADEFYELCDAYDLYRGVYYCVNCEYYNTNPSELSGYTYTEYTVAMLQEILTRYPRIAYLFLDGWGDTWEGSGQGYGDVDYDTVIDACRAIQPDILFTVNDHENPLVHGDIRLWERTAEPTAEPDAGITDYPVWLHDTQHTATAGPIPHWFKKFDAPLDDRDTAAVSNGRRYRMNRDGYGWFANFSPGPSGALESDTIEMLDDLELNQAAPQTEYLFPVGASDTVPVALPSVDNTWLKSYGSTNFSIAPAGEVWVNNSTTMMYPSTVLFKDGTVDLEFVYRSVPTNATVWLDVRGTSNADTGVRVQYDKAGSTVTCSLITFAPPSTFDIVESMTVTDGVEADQKYRIVVRAIGEELRIDHWREVDGEWILWGRVADTSSTVTDEGYISIGLTSVGSATTGIHVTALRIYPFDDVAPVSPKLTISGDETNGRFVQITRYEDAIETKLYRSDDNGANWKLTRVTDAGQVVDETWEVGNTYLYRATSRDDSYNYSGYSNVVQLTCTESDLNFVGTVDESTAGANHTWKFNTSNDLTAPNIIRENIGFVGPLCMDFSSVLGDDNTINSVSAVAFTEDGDDDPEIGECEKTKNQQKVNVPLDTTSAAAGDYIVSVKIASTDNQIFVRYGRLTLS